MLEKSDLKAIAELLQPIENRLSKIQDTLLSCALQVGLIERKSSTIKTKVEDIQDEINELKRKNSID